MARDGFSKEVLDTLARRVNLRCSKPECRQGTTGPRTDPAHSVCVGVAAHITAASPGGPRYDATLTSEQRASAENGIWLCQNHAKLVDNDASRYTAEELRAWKRDAEAAALAELEGTGPKPQEEAARLELTVGGRAFPGAKPPLATTQGYDASGHCDRHDYLLAVVVRNLGGERLSGYHVDVEFPAQALEHPERHPAYVASRSTREVAFFRASGAAAPEAFPGDAPQVIALPYYVDEALYSNERRSPEAYVYKKPVRVTLYRTGLKPMTVEHLFEAFSNY